MEASSYRKFSLANCHFFQPLLPGFQSNFSIPKSFNKYLKGEGNKEDHEKIAILRNYKVDDNLWVVKVGYFNNKLHFRNGWEKFCKDHDLQVGDFLVFRHQQNLVFDVFVFDPTACERPFPGDFNSITKNVSSPSLNIPSNKGICNNQKGLKKPAKDHNVNSASKATFKSRGYPYCHNSVKSYWKNWGAMHIPMEFARKHDLVNKKCDIKVIDQKGKEWLLALRQHKRGHCVYITKSSDFYVANDLKPEDPIVYELIASGEIPKMNFYKLTLVDIADN